MNDERGKLMLARSWLFVPGNSEKRLKKAETLDADVLIYDLEDAVAPEEKEAARGDVINALASSGKNVFVRVNSMETPYFFDDIQALLKEYYPALKGIMLPKAAEAKQIEILEHLLDVHERKMGIVDQIEIAPLIESALGVYYCFDIASSSNRIRRLVFGAIDYALDVNVTLSNEGLELLYVRSQLVIASRAAGLEPPIDTVYANFGNTEGMEAETVHAEKLGFRGKLVIHPSQISVVNSTFSPSESEIQEATEILEAADRFGNSVFQLNGKMVDEPILKKARKVMEAARVLSLFK